MTEKMKPSGITWIGDVPESWNLLKLKYFSYLKGRIGWQGLTADEFIDEGPYLITGTDFENGRIQFDRSYHISEARYAQAPEIQLQIGDLLVTKDGTVGKMAYVDELPDKASLNSHLLLIRPLEGKYHNRFLFWLMSSSVFTGYTEYSQDGTIMASLSQEKIGNFLAYFPGLEEQCAIADFLDTKCAKIDSVIADIEKQIETLQKYKKSLITEAVTKGLDRSVLMKDSGTEWIGEIPAHWKVQPLKYLTEIISKGATPDDISGETDNRYTIRFIKAENIQDNKLLNSPEFYIDRHTNSQLQRSFLHENDVLFVIAGATIGKVALVKSCFLPSNINQAVCFLRFNKMYISNAEYFCYVLQSQIITEVIKLYTVQAAQPNLSMGNIANISVPVPEQSEMFAITAYLDKKLQTVEDIIANKKEELLTIQQHKKSLIYEYVTGKKRVTEVN